MTAETAADFGCRARPAERRAGGASLPRAALAVLLAVAILSVPGRAAAADAAEPVRFAYDVPLDPLSPWPKFRRDARQTGRSPLAPADSGRAPWTFLTGKGVFSSPVIGGDGVVYVGSADRWFYAIDRDGALKWKVPTGEIIDSAALLDDQGRVIFGSGDGHVYALDRATGGELWRFAADPPAATGAFINWFEGNVAMGTDGTLVVPNDNFCTYALDRATGARRWCFRTLDQTWSLPALDPSTNVLFLGNNFAFFRNVFAVDVPRGDWRWRAAARGSVAASPLLTAPGAGGAVVVGGFDGFLRAYDPGDGGERWRLAARDHLYASPAQLSDGTIVQPAADGSVYAVDPATGAVRWAFDTGEPIRSSPAVDGRDAVYVGTGDGRLLVLNRDGTLRWALRLIDDDRDDLNSSPALGAEAIVIGGENGAVFGIPYDYCLRPAAARDDRCETGTGEGLPRDGAFLFPTSSFGRLLPAPPAEIDANQPLAFSLLVRRDGDTVAAAIDSGSLTISLEPNVPADVAVSGDRRFVTVIPAPPWAGPGGGVLQVRLRGDYLTDLERDGLRAYGGRVAGHFDQTVRFPVRPRAGGAFPLPIPRAPGEPAGVWELYRLAAPLPTILPSYNQIGFDSIHYLIGLVEGDGDRALGWAIGGRLAEGGGASEVAPGSRVRFPLVIRHDAGLLTMDNNAGFTIEFNGFPLPFERFRVAAQVDARGRALRSPALNARATCGRIDFYGEFLQWLGYCNPDTDILDVVGAAELRPYRGGVRPPPAGAGRVRFRGDLTAVTAHFEDTTLRLAEHNVGLLLVDAATGAPLPLDYTGATTHTAAADGTLASVSLAFAPGQVRGATRAIALVDTYPVARETVALPDTLPWSVAARQAARAAWDGLARRAGRLSRAVALRVAQWWS